MKRDTIVEIQNQTTVYDSERNTTAIWATVKTTKANIQALNGEIERKEYGLSESGIIKLAFTLPLAEIHKNKVGGLPQRIKTDTETMEVIGVVPYNDHYELAVRVVE